MKELTGKDIQEICKGCSKKVRVIAVENFLMSMGTDKGIALMNLNNDAYSYKWNVETVRLIEKGINLAGKEDELKIWYEKTMSGL